jgi:predicted SprT family Zn-dependent metalloprotease
MENNKLKEVRSLVLKLMNEHGLIDKGWTFYGFTNSKKSAGVCSYTRNTLPNVLPQNRFHSGKIKISKFYALQMNEEEIKNVILHEIAHALDVMERGYSKHDLRWKVIAKRIGCNAERTFESKKFNIKYKYDGYCPTCDEVVGGWYRKPKHIHKENAYICTKCKSHIKIIDNSKTSV